MTVVRDLLEAPRSELRRRLAQGHPIDPDMLQGRAYRGVSLGLPHVVERLTWKTFQKTFFRDEQTGALRGWNVRLRQTGIEGPIEPKRRRGVPVTFGHYRVVDPADHQAPDGCDRGLLIHYGLGDNKRLDPIRWLRDPIVALSAEDSSLLLGYSYLQLGPTRVPTPSYFALLDPGPVEFVPDR